MDCYLAKEEISKEIMSVCSSLEDYIKLIKDEIFILKKMKDNLLIKLDSEVFFRMKCHEFKKSLNPSLGLSKVFIPFY